VFYQIILQASSFDIPGSPLAPAHTARGLAQVETALPCCLTAQETKETTFIKKKPPTKARMKTLVKGTYPPLSIVSMEKMNFIHRNTAREVLLPVCYYKYKAASPYSCKAGLESTQPKAELCSRMGFQKAIYSPFTLERQGAYHAKMTL